MTSTVCDDWLLRIVSKTYEKLATENINPQGPELR